MREYTQLQAWHVHDSQTSTIEPVPRTLVPTPIPLASKHLHLDSCANRAVSDARPCHNLHTSILSCLGYEFHRVKDDLGWCWESTKRFDKAGQSASKSCSTCFPAYLRSHVVPPWLPHQLLIPDSIYVAGTHPFFSFSPCRSCEVTRRHEARKQ